MNTQSRATRWLTTMLLGSALAAGCTDLKESPTSSITPENFYRTDAEVLGGVASVYAQLRATEWSYYNLSEVTPLRQSSLANVPLVDRRTADAGIASEWPLVRGRGAASSPSALCFVPYLGFRIRSARSTISCQ